MANDWHYFARRLNGDGTETPLANDIPLQVESFTRSLSAPNTMNASIPVEVLRLRGSGDGQVFRRWSTAIFAEKDGEIRFGGILTDVAEDGQQIGLTIDGFAAYIYRMPYVGDARWVGADPLVLARHMWEHVQSFDGGNLALTLTEDTSDARIGTRDEPYLLNYFSTHDLGAAFDDLAEAGPFDYTEVHEWEGDTLRHRLLLGYPTLGARRTDLRLVVGENVRVVPSVEQTGDDYASEVIVLGAGEGRRMIRATAASNDPAGLRRVQVVSDQSIGTLRQANRVARVALRHAAAEDDIQSIELTDHPNAPIAAISPGDEVLIQGATSGWAGDIYMWVRVLEITTVPDTETATLSVTRTERVT